MATSLLIGNGINRLNNAEASWGNVLRVLSAGKPAGPELEFVKHKPFALLYEEILLAGVSLTSPLNETPLKHQIATLVGGLHSNQFHQRVMLTKNVRHILTTNYDYNFEKVTGLLFPRRNLQAESKYSVFRRRAAGDKYVWHIHGEAMAPATITLGYDQYSGYLQKLRGHVTAGRGNTRESPFMRGEKDFDQRDDCVYSWLDVFLRDDVHIIGLGLDFTEIDLWWALTYKGRLAARGRPVGKTYFHDWHKYEADDAVKAKRSLLTALRVEVKAPVFDQGFEAAYDAFLSNVLSA